MSTTTPCLFCRIIKGEIPSEKVYEDNEVVAFKDIHPLAPIHLLFMHKEHTDHINQLSENRLEHLIYIFKAIKIYTEKNHLDDRGFRVINNMGPDGGQSVPHTHFHLLAGKTTLPV